MTKLNNIAETDLTRLRKSPTGIKGLDDITGGGLPDGRPTLVCGSAGCGKTLLAMEFLVRGATEFGDPGLFVSFEENSDDLKTNFASLGFDLNDLVTRHQLDIDYIPIIRSEIEEAGAYDLEGLFIRLGQAIDAIGAKRVVLDTIEALFSGFSNEALLRAELRRLFSFLKEKGVTAIVTGEQGESTLTRYGLEEYVADCVIFLDHCVAEQIATRHLRIIKYRGTVHGTNQYPFLIDDEGFSVLPLSSLGLDHPVSTDRISTGIPGLDAMMGGEGFFRGSSILVTGTAGTGKSSMAAHFVAAACRRGERCLYFAFEESVHQIIRNMRSLGIDLEPWVQQGLLEFRNTRPTFCGLEMHLVSMHKAIENFRPAIAVVDPISNLIATADWKEVKSMLSRMVDFFKMQGTTAFFTDLISGNDSLEQTEVGISSLIDSWILLKTVERDDEHHRKLSILKSRGMEHSHKIKGFFLTSSGFQIEDVYIQPNAMGTK